MALMLMIYCLYINSVNPYKNKILNKTALYAVFSKIVTVVLIMVIE